LVLVGTDPASRQGTRKRNEERRKKLGADVLDNSNGWEEGKEGGLGGRTDTYLPRCRYYVDGRTFRNPPKDITKERVDSGTDQSEKSIGD
jgi:hypothetical protein